ncbi:hypothetical protein Tco_0710986 [Tanacetum coccineum]
MKDVSVIVAICNGWDLFQLDVNIAFYWRDLTEEDIVYYVMDNSEIGLLLSEAGRNIESMASATCEVIWLSNLLGDMVVKMLPVVLYCDNSSALRLTANLCFMKV